MLTTRKQRRRQSGSHNVHSGFGDFYSTESPSITDYPPITSTTVDRQTTTIVPTIITESSRRTTRNLDQYQTTVGIGRDSRPVRVNSLPTFECKRHVYICITIYSFFQRYFLFM
jgi:hypothetical protein